MTFDPQAGGHAFIAGGPCIKCKMTREEFDDRGGPSCPGTPPPEREPQYPLLDDPEANGQSGRSQRGRGRASKGRVRNKTEIEDWPDLNSGKEWSERDLFALANSLRMKSPVEEIATFLRRSRGEVRAKVEALEQSGELARRIEETGPRGHRTFEACAADGSMQHDIKAALEEFSRSGQLRAKVGAAACWLAFLREDEFPEEIAADVGFLFSVRPHIVYGKYSEYSRIPSRIQHEWFPTLLRIYRLLMIAKGAESAIRLSRRSREIPMTPTEIIDEACREDLF